MAINLAILEVEPDWPISVGCLSNIYNEWREEVSGQERPYRPSVPGDHSERFAEEHAEYLELSEFALKFEFERVGGVRRAERSGWEVRFEAAQWRDGMDGNSEDGNESTQSGSYSGSSSESDLEWETDSGSEGGSTSETSEELEDGSEWTMKQHLLKKVFFKRFFLKDVKVVSKSRFISIIMVSLKGGEVLVLWAW